MKTRNLFLIGTFLFIIGLTVLRQEIRHQVDVIWFVSMIMGLIIPAISLLWWRKKEALRFPGNVPLDFNQELISSNLTKKILKISTRLSQRGGIKPPNLFIIPSEKVIAYSYKFHPNKGTIKISTGLIQKYNLKTIEGIIAHEMVHLIKNDSFKGLFRTFIGVWVLSAAFLVGMHITSLIFSAMIFFEIYQSRKKEYEADTFATELTSVSSVLSYMIDSLAQRESQKTSMWDKVKQGINLEDKFKGFWQLITYQAAIYGLDLFGTHPSWRNRIDHLLYYKKVELSHRELNFFIHKLVRQKKLTGKNSVIKLEDLNLTPQQIHALK